MDVCDLLFDLLRREHIAVVAAAPQPEPGVPAFVGDLAEHRRVKFPPPGNDAFCEPGLECPQHIGDRRRPRKADEQMDMLRHDNPRVEQERVPLAGPPELMDKLVLDRIVVKEREPVLAREGEEPGVVRMLVPTHPRRISPRHSARLGGEAVRRTHGLAGTGLAVFAGHNENTRDRRRGCTHGNEFWGRVFQGRQPGGPGWRCWKEASDSTMLPLSEPAQPANSFCPNISNNKNIY